jgi:hypothetical protein
MSAALIATPRPSHPAVLTVTVRPAPRREPPFDDELASAVRRAIGPLDQPLPFERARPRGLYLVPHARPITRIGRPDAAQWGRRLLIGLIETAGGKRPLPQLAALLSPGVAAGVAADFERAAALRKPHWTHTATIRSVRASEPADGVAELCASLQSGRRVRAVAMRLELRADRWRCTRLVLG